MYPNHHENQPTDMTMIAAVSELHHAFDQWMGQRQPRKRPSVYRRMVQQLIGQVRQLMPASQPLLVPRELAENGD